MFKFTESRKDQTAEMVRNNGNKVTTHVLDVADREQVYRFADDMVAEQRLLDPAVADTGAELPERTVAYLACPGCGTVSMHPLPDGETMSIYDAAMQYREEGTPLVVIAGVAALVSSWRAGWRHA